ncbi:hypothetical protein CASFOL_027213 [Castilleja foliolosa]|uniref:Uncharacterized protein n=1 Tax=Castilleja foliolosa TaxID=1961234 RepID=A0ABD3CF24_9LAMI
MMADEIENGEIVMTSSEHDKSTKQIDGCFVKCGDFFTRCSTIRHILSSLKRSTRPAQRNRQRASIRRAIKYDGAANEAMEEMK